MAASPQKLETTLTDIESENFLLESHFLSHQVR